MIEFLQGVTVGGCDVGILWALHANRQRRRLIEAKRYRENLINGLAKQRDSYSRLEEENLRLIERLQRYRGRDE